MSTKDKQQLPITDWTRKATEDSIHTPGMTFKDFFPNTVGGVGANHPALRNLGQKKPRIKFLSPAADPELYSSETPDITIQTTYKGTLKLHDLSTTLLNNSPNPVLVINPDNSIGYVNRAFEKLTDFSASELLGKKFPYPYWPEKEASTIRATLESSMRGTGIRRFERKFRNKSGELFWVETTGSPIKDSRGNLKCYLVNWVDITATKRATEALEESNRFNLSIMEKAPNPIEVINPDTSIRYVNPAFEIMTGYALNEIVNRKPPYPWWREENIPEYTADFSRVVRVESYRSESLFRKKNGESIWVEKHLTAVKENGTLKYYLSNWVDNTERKKTEESLQRSLIRYKDLSESISGVFFAMDGDLNYTYWNKASEKLTGIPAAQALGRHFFDVFPKNEVTRKLQDKFSKALIDGQTQHFITKYPGQTNLVHEISTYPSIDGISVFVKDITEHQKVMENLSLSEAKYRSLVETASAGVASIDTQGKLTFINDALSRLMGFSRDEILGRSIASFVHKDDLSPILARLDEAGRTGPAGTDLEFRVCTRSQDIIWFHTNPKPIIVDGRITGFSIILHDVTDRKLALDSLRESEAKFRCLAEQSPNMIFIYKKGAIFYANQRCEEITGFTKNDLYSPDFKPMAILSPASLKLLRGIKVEDSLDGTPHPLELAFFDRKGKEIEVILATRSVNYGGEKAILGIMTDISERKQAEKKLRNAAEEWRTTFDSITDLVYIRDAEYRIVRVNKAFADVFGKKPQDIIGKSCCQIMHGTNEPHPECLHRRMVATKKPVIAEYHEPSLNMYIHESISPIFDESGQVTGTVNVVRDITEHKRLEKQLIMTDRLATIGELAAGIAHELNNPLTGVIGFSQLMMEGEVPLKMKEDLTVIVTEAQRAAKIVKNLLTFARKHQPVKQLNQVNDCINEVLNIRAYEQKNHNIRVVTHLAELPKIMMDYFQIQQVFINLIINAEFFMSECHNGGTLTISTRTTGDSIVIVFSDDGPGVTREDLKHLFSPFFTTKAVGKGTGLGLAICHGIISEHGGRISAESEAGRGASFTVELPIKGNEGGLIEDSGGS